MDPRGGLQRESIKNASEVQPWYKHPIVCNHAYKYCVRVSDESRRAVTFQSPWNCGSPEGDGLYPQSTQCCQGIGVHDESAIVTDPIFGEQFVDDDDW